MKMIFDKVYVISYVKNIKKQNYIKKYLTNKLNIEFEFMYGCDMYDIPNINLIEMDNANYEKDKKLTRYYIHQIAVTISHLTLIQEAYNNENINSILIFEDDCCFYKDLNFIKEYLYKEIPKDADIIQYGWHDIFPDITSKLNIGFNKVGWMPGSICYAICNKDAMKHIIDFQSKHFTVVDYNIIYDDLNVYICYPPLYVDYDEPEILKNRYNYSNILKNKYINILYEN